MVDQTRIGMVLHATDGDAGVIEDILCDDKGTPRFLVVRDKGVFGGDAVLPVDVVTATGGTARAAMSRREVHDADPYSADKYGEHVGLFSQAAAQYDQRAEQR